MQLTVKQTGWWVYKEALAQREDFTTYGALRGAAGTVESVGRLPAEYRESVSTADYVVYSYVTPIAWHVSGRGWEMPDEHYSATTSAHQGKIRTAISQLREEATS
jgi:hypothetical protein